MGLWIRQWHPTPLLVPGKSRGWRNMEGCSPWGRWGLDTTERLHFHFSLSFIGEGNGNLLQCSCLENPRDGGAWWAAVYVVAKSRTRLRWLSSSSISMGLRFFLYEDFELKMQFHRKIEAIHILLFIFGKFICMVQMIFLHQLSSQIFQKKIIHNTP